MATALLTRRRFTVAEYQRMVDAGILAEDDRVEPIEGEIVEKRPIGSHHAAQVKRLASVLQAAVAGRAIVSVQDPIELDDASQPEPDLALLRPRPDFYAERHPRPADVEVSDTTPQCDREVKVPLYARADIPAVWRVDAPGPEGVEVHEDPAAGRYGRTIRAGRGERLAAPGLDEVMVEVDAILG